MLASVACMFLPIFIPSPRGAAGVFQSVIDMAMMTMYLISFPMSLLGVPLLYVVQILLGIDPNTIGGKYLNVFTVFLLGAVQWFWLVPRLLTRRREEQILVSAQRTENLPPAPADVMFFFGREQRTPLERVLDDRHD
jgi:hypothetical protein